MEVTVTYLNTHEAAEYVGTVKARTIVDWIKSGRLKASRHPHAGQRGRYRILESDLREAVGNEATPVIIVPKWVRNRLVEELGEAKALERLASFNASAVDSWKDILWPSTDPTTPDAPQS